MKLGIDISQIVYEGTGVSRYTQGLTDAILQYDNENQWVFFFSSFRKRLNNVIRARIIAKGYKIVQYPFPPTLLSFIWNDLHILKIESFVGKLDWFITSDWVEPPSDIKKATIVHDLVYLKYPKTVDEIILATQTKRMKWVKKESSCVFCVSHTTKKDCVDILRIEDKKLHAIHSGVEIQIPQQEAITRTLKKFNISKPFILTVGKIEPRKNISRLIDAYNMLPSDSPPLVIVGPTGWGNQPTPKNNRIKILGYVNNDELFSLYASCLFFIYPSLYEGYGYPVCEAMKMGTAVATSKIPSLVELAGEASYMFDPLNVQDIARAIKTLIHDEKLRKELGIKGKRSTESLTWENCVKEMIHVLQS